MSAEILSRESLELALRDLPGWSLKDGELFKAFDFADFPAAFGFLTQVALLAESQDHHPEFRNVYRHVELRLITHSAGGVTPKDVRLASDIERISKS